jgi:glycosyltransferase 2 family protein
VDPEERTFAHPVTMAVVGVAALAASFAIANLDPVPSWERSLTRWINSAPGWVADAVYPVMQLGALWAPIVVAVVVVVAGTGSSAARPVAGRKWLVAGSIVVAGVVAWLAAKGVKEMVGRDRPLTYLSDIIVRDGDGVGLGYVSGHSAVAAATATVLMLVVPRRARPLLVIAVAIVGVARVVHGVHLVADVVGGWALGMLIGLAVVEVVERLASRRAPTRSADASL